MSDIQIELKNKKEKKNSLTIHSGSEMPMYSFVVRVVHVYDFLYLFDQLQVIAEPKAIASHLCAIFTCFFDIIFIWKASYTTKALIISCDGTRTSTWTLNTGHVYLWIFSNELQITNVRKRKIYKETHKTETPCKMKAITLCRNSLGTRSNLNETVVSVIRSTVLT